MGGDDETMRVLAVKFAEISRIWMSGSGGC
jgi:hypothetical protein